MLLKLLRKFWHAPRWLKMVVLLAALALLAYPHAMRFLERRHKHEIVYNQLFPYYYEVYKRAYLKQKVKPEDAETLARHYGAFYANYYADYFSSDAYQYALQFALPDATAENFKFPENSANAQLTLNRRGLELLKHFEGLRAEPYFDQGGKLTIGYGHLIRENERFVSLSEAEAEALLAQDVKLAEAIIKRKVTVTLNENQFAALVSLIFNIGSGGFEKSTLLQVLNRGDLAGAADEFPRWNKIGRQASDGLSRRREAERALFLQAP